MSYFSQMYTYASLIRKGNNPDIRFVSNCAFCYKSLDTPKPLQCAACHCVRYCGPACQKLAWKGHCGATGRGGYYRQSHKEECAEIKGYTTELPDLQAVLMQFPWARVEKDGRFNFELALAMRRLLGSGPKFGFWTIEEPDSSITMKTVFASGSGPTTNTCGSVLLSKKHFDEESGWKLPEAEIPWLTFGQGREAPSFPPVFEHNWTSYYKWRGLPLKSPAALLLHWPLSIYRLLYLLDFVSLDNRGERSKLTIHCIGVELEINCLPVFGELALLLPNMDVDIVMFGQSAYNIVNHAKPPALAAQKYAYEYQAPGQCGSGLIRIQLYKSSPTWDPVDILSRKLVPDLLFAFNAGMTAYDAWSPVFSTSRALSIPFAITEFSRLSLVEAEYHFATFIAKTVKDGDRLIELWGQEKMRTLAESLSRQPSCAINPFMRPGIKLGQSNCMPTAVNGFSCIITPRSEVG